MRITFQCFLKLLHIVPRCSYLKMSHRKLIGSSVFRNRTCHLVGFTNRPGTHHQCHCGVFSPERIPWAPPFWGKVWWLRLPQNQVGLGGPDPQYVGFHLLPAFSAAPLPRFFHWGWDPGLKPPSLRISTTSQADF